MVKGWIKGAAAVVAFGFLVAGGFALFNMTGFSQGTIDGPQMPGEDKEGQDQMQVPAELKGESADVKVKATDKANESTPAVGVNVEAFAVESDGAETYLSSVTTNSDGTRKAISDYIVGDVFKVYAVDSSYYGAVAPDQDGRIVDAKTERANLNVYGHVSTSDVTQTLYDSDGSSSTSITIDSGETYNAEKFRVRADAEDVSYNYEYLYFNTTNIDNELDEVRVDGATRLDSVPDKLSDDFGAAFKLGQAGDLTAGEKPSLMAFDKHEAGQIQFDMESGKNPSGEIEICSDDAALYKNSDDQIMQGGEDNNGNDVGVSMVCKQITIG